MTTKASALTRENGGRLIELAEKLSRRESLRTADLNTFLPLLYTLGEELLRPKRKANRPSKNETRDFWIAMDFHTRSGSHRAKKVATSWKMKPAAIAVIASRWKLECEKKFCERPASFWRDALKIQKSLLLHNSPDF